MPKQATYRVIEWDSRPDKVGSLALDCDHCGREAALPVALEAERQALAANGLGVIFDVPPKGGWMPGIVQCRKCRHIFELSNTRQEDDVR